MDTKNTHATKKVSTAPECLSGLENDTAPFEESKRPATTIQKPLEQHHVATDCAKDTGTTSDANLASFYKALHLIPRLEKTAYLEAQAHYSDPMRFVRCEDGKAEAAASRFAKYWEKRKELFGSRAFLPMNQSGEGSLSPEDVETVKTGYIALLPSKRQERSRCHGC
jgi:hypothetical protein